VREIDQGPRPGERLLREPWRIGHYTGIPGARVSRGCKGLPDVL
jgi:hypothetical protein